MFDVNAISRNRESCDCDGVGGGERMTKIVAEKNRRLRTRSAFLWCLQPFSRTGWRSQSASFNVIKPLGLSSTPGLLSCLTMPLGRVAPPIWPCNLQCGHAFRSLLLSAPFRYRRHYLLSLLRTTMHAACPIIFQEEATRGGTNEHDYVSLIL